MRFKDKRVLTIKTKEDMLRILERGNSIKDYKKGIKITVYNKMEENYSYILKENPGKNMEFTPYYTPAEMLQLGVFEGKYLNDCLLEFPKEWFLHAMDKLSPEGARPELNRFKIKSRMNLEEWLEYGWVPSKNVAKQYPNLSSDKNHDIRGWFQWYCRYWMGRREEIDEVQIKRWNAFKRHAGQIAKNCKKGDVECRPRQRQGLLQWAYNGDI